MPLNYYREDCEASNSSSGEDSQASDSIVLSPRKLHNRLLNINKSRSKTNIKPCHYNRTKIKKSSVHHSHRSVSSCEVDSVDEKNKISPTRLSASSKCIADISVPNTAQIGELNHRARNKNKSRMPHRRRSSKIDEISMNAKERLTACGEGIISVPSQFSNESRRVFPFLQTPSGNLKVGPSQVVFESKKVSVLVADPKHTKVNVRAEVANKQLTDGSAEGSLLRLRGAHINPEKSDFGHMPILSNTDNIAYDDDYQPSQLEKEYSLQRLTSATLPGIDYNKTLLPYKTELFTRLLHRITNYINPDVEILISNEVFSCHLLVLQCYSDYFDRTKQASKVRLDEISVTPRAFMTIYNWMIYPGSDSYCLLSRENILEIFVASQYLAIKELEEQCWTFITSDLIFSEETAFLLYMNAKEIGNTTVTQLMIPRIMRFFLKLVGTTNFLNLDLEDVCTLMRSNYVAIHNEIEVFMAAVRWLMHDWSKRKLHLTEVMKCVRFGWIAPWQLVDIRRNPENPEFMRVTSQADVQQYIEDGLSYAIIKYWYGNQTQDYYHWIDLLGLQEPNQRNWIDEEKNYVTYREFLKDLEIYQEDNALEAMQLRSQQPNTKTDSFPPPPTVAEFMAQRAKKLEEMSNTHATSKLKASECSNETELFPMLTQAVKSEEEVKTVFQNSKLHDYNSCNDLQNEIQNSKRNNSSINLEDDKFHTTEQNYHSANAADNTAHILELPNTAYLKATAASTSPVDVIQQKQENISLSNREGDFSDEMPLHNSTKIIQKTDENLNGKQSKPKTLYTKPAARNEMKLPANKKPENKISSRFPHFVKKTLRPLQYMYQMNISTLKSSHKDYLMEGSLFFPDEEAVLVFGGTDPHNVYGVGRNTGKDIYRYQPHLNTWELIGELPEPRHHHSVAFLKGKVFLVGGADPRDDDNQGKSIVVNTTWSYSPVSRTWSSESAMLIPRKNFGLVVTNGKLYAIGGQDKMGRVLSSVECYDPIIGIWEEMASLTVGRMGIAATKFRDFIWVAGGMTSSKSTSVNDTVEGYDTRRNIWLPFGTLRFSRCFSRLFAMNDILYLIGGAGQVNETNSSTASAGAIDTWDDYSKGWCLQDEMAIPRHGHSLAYLGTQILIIGGVTTMYMRALSNVECFCCVRGTWIHGIANLPTPLSGHGSITLPPASLM